MKQKDIVNAYMAINRHQADKLPLKVSLALFKTKRLLQDQVDFQTQKEKEVYDKYNPQRTSNGMQFESPEQKDQFINELNALIAEIGEMDIDLEVKKFSISLSQDVEMSIEDIEALEPFIDFTE